MGLDTGHIGTLIVIIFLTSFVGIIVTGIVVDDYVKTTRYGAEICQGTTANYTLKRSNMCIQANIPTTIIKNNITYDVNLYYPPIDHWLVVCQSSSGIIDWINAIRENTFTCYVDHVATGDTSRGIINKLNQGTLVGFAFGFTFSLIFFVLSGSCVAYNIYYIITHRHKQPINSLRHYQQNLAKNNPPNNLTMNSTSYPPNNLTSNSTSYPTDNLTSNSTSYPTDNSTSYSTSYPTDNSTSYPMDNTVLESSTDISISIEDDSQFKYNTYGQEYAQYLHDQQNAANKI